MGTKIINIITHPPAYELYSSEPRPEINWDTPAGAWVGIWGYDWADLIGKEVLKLTDEFEYEVWQQDPRADKVYKYIFSNGLRHILFPAEERHAILGLKKGSLVTSRSICQSLLSEKRGHGLLLHLNSADSGISSEILDMDLNCPIILQFLGEIHLPLTNLIRPQRNILNKAIHISEHFATKGRLKKVGIVSCVNEENEGILKRYFKNEIVHLHVGIDFDFWRSILDRIQAKRILGLDNGKLTLLSSSRLNSLKQVDRIIEILKRLDRRHDFQYIVTGHGTREYERYLKNLGEELIKKDKLRFVGYVAEENLRLFYNAADLFISASISEGMPVSAVKAMAMEMPILISDTGLAAKFLYKYNFGRVIPKGVYKIWERELENILSGDKIKIIDRELARAFFHWPYVATEYIKVYRDLISKF